MASPVRNASKPALLPPGVSDFLRRRLVEGLGLVIALAGGALVLTLTSYHPGDPSLNTAVPGVARNWLGETGAWTADILVQTNGLASWLIGIVLIGWGWRTGAHLGLGRLWLRICALPVALLLGAVALAGLPAPAEWPLKTGLGGFTGDMLLAKLVAAGAAANMEQVHVVSMAAALALAALVTALGISFAEWRRVGLALIRFGAAGARAGATGGRMGMILGRWSLRTAARSREAIAGRRRESSLDRGKADGADRATDGRRARREPRLSPAGREDRQRDDIVAPRRSKPARGKRAESARQAKLDFAPAQEYRVPDLDLLDGAPVIADDAELNDDALAENARYLESVLEDFGVLGEVVKVRPGPVVTLYELEPAPGTKSSRVIGLADDIARSMSAVSVRVAVIPGRNVIGIELPNARRETVSLKELLSSEAYERTGTRLSLVLGKDISGTPVIADLSRMPHLLIAGTTGSGKSVALNTMILSLLYRLSPDQCRFIMIDPKMLELSVYDGIPHLLAPVVTDPGKAVVALRWAVREMENRYRAMSNLGVRNIATYNVRITEALRKGEQLTRTVQTGFDSDTGAPIYEEQPLDMEPLPHVVVVVDEMADLMLVAGKDVEASVQRLSQMARAAGIHLIMATQRPSVDVITGTIKANFPTRISFQVTSKIDSRTILGEAGAEQLLGHGDMLYMAGGGRLMRVHGPLVTDLEVERVVTELKDQGEPEYLDDVTEEEFPPAMPGGVGGGVDDELYDQAVALVCRERRASTSFVQRHLQIGYNRAARIVDRMEAEGVISPANHVGKREVLARNIDDPAV
jgi:S-DNA-T family DNA segregation ATPase FtsK/SpoIIIE